MNELRSGFHAGNIRSYEARDFQLRKFLALLKDNQDRLVKAVVADLKCPSDALLEFKYLVSETCHAIRNLKEWMNPTHVHKTIGKIISFEAWDFIMSLAYKFDDCYTRPDPLGIVLIIGAWNYPLTVLLEPFIGALSAGNCVVLKPSEVSSNTAIILAELIPKYMDTKMVRLVNTDGPGTRALMDLKWDHVFFTGSSKIGTLIYEEAAKQLTPVTLELGGKR